MKTLKLKLLISRLKLGWRIVRGDFNHYALVNVKTEANLLKVACGKPVEIDWIVRGMEQQTFARLLTMMARTVTNENIAEHYIHEVAKAKGKNAQLRNKQYYENN